MKPSPSLRAPAIALVLVGSLAGGACADPAESTHEGIAVGNPGVVAMSLAASPDVQVTLASLRPDWVGFAACGGQDRVVYPGGTVDLAVAPLQVDVPAGTWCGVAVRFGAGARLEASWDDGVGSGTLVADLDLPELTLRALEDGLAVDEDTMLALELGSPGWFDVQALGLVDGEEAVVAPSDPRHEVLVAALRDESALFDDLDASGLVDLPERQAGPLALPGELAFNPDVAAGLSSDSVDAAGCSAAPGGSGPGLAWLLGLALVVLGRRAATAEGRLLP